jgi:hypothetical protein
MVREVNERAIERVRNLEHEGQPAFHSGPNMKRYTSSCERPLKRSGSVAIPSSVELVLFTDSNPRQLLPLPRQFVAAVCELVLFFEQRRATLPGYR